MKQVVLFLISLFYFASISAQITEKDHEKYWHYRNRLRTYYMHVGEGPGASIPAGIRNFINWETGEPSIIHWGDATLYLGWYMGVLATEYHLLNKNNQETKEILEELNYALLAVERLDSIAELRWDLPSSVNGFLIRDDIPENFLELHPHLNHNLNDKIFYNEKSGQALKVRQVVSDFIINPHNAFSQDQLVHLLMGLVLAAEFSPSQIFSLDVDVNGGIVNYKINPKEKAIFLTDKLVEYASNITGKEPWQLRYPTGETISNSRGGDLRANATAIAHIGKKVSATKKDFLVNIPFNLIWQMQQSMVALRKNISSLHMALVSAATSNYWRGFLGENTTEDAINFQGNSPAGTYLWINYEANQYGWNNFYNYLRIAIHNYDKINYNASEEIIKSAPFDGPFYHLEDNTAGGGWAASRRFIDTPPRQSTGSIHFPGNYNGLDFMLFFNLYHLADTKANPELYKKPQGFKFDF